MKIEEVNITTQLCQKFVMNFLMDFNGEFHALHRSRNGFYVIASIAVENVSSTHILESKLTFATIAVMVRNVEFSIGIH